MLIAGAGGMIGTCARFSVNRLCATFLSPDWPWGTMTVNLLGCLLIGVIIGLLERWEVASSGMLNALLITGFCGGFTTFSAFSADTLRMIDRGAWTPALGYILLSVVGGIILAWAGRAACLTCKVA